MFMRIALAAALLVLAAAPALAQADAQYDVAAAQEAWGKAARPGPFHEFLARKAGDWKVTARTWMAPDAEPETSESTATIETILGGRYLVEHMSGTSMGAPFEGMGVTGYDNVTGQVTSIWMDTMGTTILVMTGAWSEPGAPLETRGTMADPISGQPMQLRTVSTYISEYESLFESFASMGGIPETKMMELRYKRVK